ncbi:twin transmembrane helix small protein [Sphingomonas sp. LB-2]|uniref:twin transmembrane helix small protein n=1 Tax=Sphingomonas caeni TaxID=2984949 RepID=UPI00222FBB7F|nr:twin transmembrane helix small protein [Sphingomonas caeni]MCW3846363.1 twin transmembrane helix small protein [Sphingomonas caeni]
MTLFAVLLIVALMIATFVTLIMGLINMTKSVRGEAESEGEGPSERALRSNKLMWYRIYFQLGAVLVIALLLFAAGANR